MLNYPDINPVAFKIGSLEVYWYGVSYLLGFIGCYILSVYRAPKFGYVTSQVSDMLFYVVLGIIIGGRLGFILFYNPSLILKNPLSLIAIWEPGRSFHGGMLGVLVALLLYVRFSITNFFRVTDFIAPSVPIGLGFGRLGNFINGELYGRVTNLPWGMVFPHVDTQPRHPSQLYEFMLEGVILCLWLLWYAKKPRDTGRVSGMFLLGYGIMRCIVETVREPDPEYGFIAFNWLTMGQILSAPMIIFGLYLLFRKVR